MGCWNGTCFLTRLSIHDGDDIVLFPIVRNAHFYRSENHAAGFSYVDDVYKPVTLPLFGKYNDYGGIDEITNPTITYSVIVSQLWETIRFYRLTMKEYQQEPQPVVANNLLELLELIEREKIPGLGFVMAHRDAYDRILAGNLEVLTRIYDEHDEFIKMMDTESEDEMHKRILLEMERYPERFPYKYWMIREIFTIRDDDLRTALVNYVGFNMMMDSGRLAWMPTAGKGSQDDSYKVQRTIATATNAIIKERKARRKADGY